MKVGRLTKAYTAGVVGAVVALAATVFAVGSTGQRPSVVDGASWLWSSMVGETTQINAVSGLPGLSHPLIDSQGHPVRITQSDQYVILHDLQTGRVTSIDLTRLGFSGSLDLGSVEDTVLLLQGDTAVVIDRTRGLIRPLNPATLQVSGEITRLPAPLVGGAFDDSGRLWLSLPTEGTAVALTVQRGRLRVDRTESVTTPGHDTAISVLDEGALVIDREEDVIAVVTDEGITKIPSPVPLADAVVPDRTVGPSAAITVPAEETVLTIGDTKSGEPLTTLPMPAEPGTEPVPAVCFGGRVYVPHVASGAIEVFTVDGEPAGTIPVGEPNTVVELEVRENYLFINAPDTEAAVLVNREGEASTVEKYDPRRPATPSPRPTPEPPTAEPPAPPTAAPPPPAPEPEPEPTWVPAPPQPPGPPVPVIALASDGEVHLSWGRANPGSAPVDGYVITWSEDGGGQVRVGGDVLETTVGGLTNGTTYQFRVIATNAIGAGPPALSEPVTPRESTPPARPAAPVAALELNGAGHPTGAVEVTWKEVPGATDYVVTPYRDGEAGLNPPQTVTGTYARFAGLAAGHRYTFTVTARNQYGRASAASERSNAVRVHYAPGAPGGVVGYQVGANSYLIRWTASPTHDTPVKSYTVRDGAGKVLATVDGSTLRATVTATNLRSVTVTANSDDGDSPPGTGTVHAATAPSVAITSIGAKPRSLTVEFTVQPYLAGASCEVSVSPRSGGGLGVEIMRTGCDSPATFTGLEPYTVYEVTIVVRNFRGTATVTATKRTEPINAGSDLTCVGGSSATQTTRPNPAAPSCNPATAGPKPTCLLPEGCPRAMAGLVGQQPRAGSAHQARVSPVAAHRSGPSRGAEHRAGQRLHRGRPSAAACRRRRDVLGVAALRQRRDGEADC
jgi:hypothetical protein